MIRALVYAFFGFFLLSATMTTIGSFYFSQSTFFYQWASPLVAYGGAVLLGVLGFTFDRKKRKTSEIRGSSPVANAVRRVLAWFFMIVGAVGFIYMMYTSINVLFSPGPYSLAAQGGLYAGGLIIVGIIFPLVIFVIGFTTLRELERESTLMKGVRQP